MGHVGSTFSVCLARSVREVIPKASFLERPIVSRIRKRQTEYFRPGSKGCLFEIDYCISLP